MGHLALHRGLFECGGHSARLGLVLNWLTRSGHRPELGLHFAGLGLGIVVSGLAVAMMDTRSPGTGMWIGLGLIGAAVFVPAWIWLPAPAVSHAASAEGSEAARRSLRPVDAADGRRLLLRGFSASSSGATFIVAILEKLPVFEGHGGWVWVMVGLAATPSSFIWDRIAGRLGQIRALILAYGLQAVAILVPALTGAPALNLASAVLFGGTFVGIVSLSLTLIGRHFPANPAKAMAQPHVELWCGPDLCSRHDGLHRDGDGQLSVGVGDHGRGDGSRHGPASAPRRPVGVSTSTNATALPRPHVTTVVSLGRPPENPCI